MLCVVQIYNFVRWPHDQYPFYDLEPANKRTSVVDVNLNAVYSIQDYVLQRVYEIIIEISWKIFSL